MREYSTSTPTELKASRRLRQRRKSEEEIYGAAAPPTAKRRFKKHVQMRATVSQPDLVVTHSDWSNIEEEEEEEPEELEPKMQFHLHGTPVRPSSTSQSTETIPPGEDPVN